LMQAIKLYERQRAIHHEAISSCRVVVTMP
jgi:hypothetical protein